VVFLHKGSPSAEVVTSEGERVFCLCDSAGPALQTYVDVALEFATWATSDPLERERLAIVEQDAAAKVGEVLSQTKRCRELISIWGE
jgi:hypothetical protein